MPDRADCVGTTESRLASALGPSDRPLVEAPPHFSAPRRSAGSAAEGHCASSGFACGAVSDRASARGQLLAARSPRMRELIPRPELMQVNAVPMRPTERGAPGELSRTERTPRAVAESPRRPGWSVRDGRVPPGRADLVVLRRGMSVARDVVPGARFGSGASVRSDRAVRCHTPGHHVGSSTVSGGARSGPCLQAR